MLQAARRIPHFSYVEEFDLTELEALRRELNAERSAAHPKLTLLPFFMRALVRLVPEFPQLNAHYDDEAGVLRSFEAVHIGIATQSDSGLLVPSSVTRKRSTYGVARGNWCASPRRLAAAERRERS